jgi:hypothetical protein
MDERLTWEKHIDNICAKVGAGIGFMRRFGAGIGFMRRFGAGIGFMRFCSSRNT